MESISVSLQIYGIAFQCAYFAISHAAARPLPTLRFVASPGGVLA